VLANRSLSGTRLPLAAKFKPPLSTVAVADPDPFQEIQYPNAMAAKRAIADYLGTPLAKLSAEHHAEINGIVAKTLDKKQVLDEARRLFRQRTGGQRDAE
jgi:hypothetical protein